MKGYRIISGKIKDFDVLQPLWEKLKNLHEELAPNFSSRFNKIDWNKRKESIIKKSSKVFFEYVIEEESNQIIGYCISTIEKKDNTIGEIDSLFIEQFHRKTGVGKILVENAINWLIKEKTETQRLIVAAGNENVLSYYSQFDFFPLHIVLQRKEPE